MGAALTEIKEQIREETSVAILEQIKIIRSGNAGQVVMAQENLKVLLMIPDNPRL